MAEFSIFLHIAANAEFQVKWFSIALFMVNWIHADTAFLFITAAFLLKSIRFVWHTASLDAFSSDVCEALITVLGANFRPCHSYSGERCTLNRTCTICTLDKALSVVTIGSLAHFAFVLISFTTFQEVALYILGTTYLISNGF